MQIAFRIAPRINAAGRMDVASDVVELFTTRDPDRARALAEKLDLLNSERRQTEATALAEIDLQLRDDLSFANASCIVLDGRGWHRGVVGILASRVVDRTGRPALVISHGAHGTGEEDGQAHGSGRSIHGFHLLDAIASCHDLFTRFGGHAHAVGFSLPSQRVPELRSRLCAFASDLLTPDLLTRKLRCDVVIELEALTPQFHRALRQLEPFGIGNEEPLFVALGVTLEAPPTPIKEHHLRLRVRSASGRVSFSALGWRMADRVQNLNLATGSTIDLAFRLRENEHPNFGGLELEIADLRLSGSDRLSS